ncbi:MAG: hypothetical protein FJ095_10355 [Deltaproteobacteria bacterium]|nr:hypothetical protein [Deltaproteobacteria bacterium]
MSRSTLVLYELERARLKAFSTELEAALANDDRVALAALLDLDDTALVRRPRLVDHFLVPERGSDAPVHEALRRAARRRALVPRWTSDNPALEGRLRAFDALRDDAAASAAVDRLLNPRRVPWYLRRPAATCGWLDGPGREELARRLARMRSSLTPELRAFADGLDAVRGDVIAHDAL